jgi:hypothetical protein
VELRGIVLSNDVPCAGDVQVALVEKLARAVAEKL